MDDLIRRQDAINTALEFFVEFLGGAFHEKDQKTLLQRMNDLSSIEPEVIRCKDCKYYYNVLYSGTQSEYGKCCRTFTEDVKPDDYCSRGEQE